MILANRKTKNYRLLTLQLAATMFVALVASTLLSIQPVSAQAVTYYNTASDGVSDSQCNEGDYRLTNGIQFANQETGRGIVYYCITLPGGAANLNVNTLRPPSGCAFGQGELDLGGYGVHCLPNDLSSPVYVGGRPIISASGGTTHNSTTTTDLGTECTDTDVDANNCVIVRYLVLFINLLSALVGIVVTISIIVGGIQYTTAGSDPQKVSAAKNRIRNALFALFVFIFSYSFLNWLVPGGLL